MDSDDSNLAYWSNDGRVICIPNATQFSSNVLPRHFKHNNWPSFVRQLNRTLSKVLRMGRIIENQLGELLAGGGRGVQRRNLIKKRYLSSFDMECCL